MMDCNLCCSSSSAAKTGEGLTPESSRLPASNKVTVRDGIVQWTRRRQLRNDPQRHFAFVLTLHSYFTVLSTRVTSIYHADKMHHHDTRHKFGVNVKVSLSHSSEIQAAVTGLNWSTRWVFLQHWCAGESPRNIGSDLKCGRISHDLCASWISIGRLWQNASRIQQQVCIVTPDIASFFFYSETGFFFALWQYSNDIARKNRIPRWSERGPNNMRSEPMWLSKRLWNKKQYARLFLKAGIVPEKRQASTYRRPPKLLELQTCFLFHITLTSSLATFRSGLWVSRRSPSETVPIQRPRRLRRKQRMISSLVSLRVLRLYVLILQAGCTWLSSLSAMLRHRAH